MAWIDYLNLGRYHKQLKTWMNENKYVHPFSHPATMIVQDALNQFVTKEEKINWNKKLDADANAASASKLYKGIKINGVFFDGTKDITIDASNSYDEKVYTSVIPAKTNKIIVPKEYWSAGAPNLLYINGLKLTLNKHYSFNMEEHSITLNQVYNEAADVEVIFNTLSGTNTLSYILEPNTTSIKLETSKKINEHSIIHIYIDGIKLIFSKHYTINYELKSIELKENYKCKKDVEILILKE